MLLPFLIGSTLLFLLPALATLFISFTEYNAIGTPEWVGFAKYVEAFTSPLVNVSLRSTAIFLLSAVPLRILGALLLALLLQKKSAVFAFHRAAVYIPTLIPEVAYALIWLWLLNPFYGPINSLLGLLRLPQPAWLAEPNSAIAAFVLMSLFPIGEGFLILLAGLRAIPRSLFEVAKVDGANRWQIFSRITLPLLLPWLLVLTFRDLLIALERTYTPSFVMTYGGPYYATTFTPLLVYEAAFDFFDFGLAAAVLVITYLVIGALVIGLLMLFGLIGNSDA